MFLLKQSRLWDGGKHAPGKEFQRDAVFQMLEWLVVVCTSQQIFVLHQVIKCLAKV